MILDANRLQKRESEKDGYLEGPKVKSSQNKAHMVARI